MKKLMIALALAGFCGQAAAERPWLLPSASFVEGPEAWVLIDGAISEMLFDFDHMPLKLDGLSIIAPDGTVSAPVNPVMGRLRSSFEVKMTQTGTYKFSNVVKASFASYKQNGEMKRWRGAEENMTAELPKDATEVRATVSHQRLETFVTNTKASVGALKPSGQGLELEPISNPGELRTGEKASWRFLLNGKPLANYPFSLIPGGVRYRGVINEKRLSTDANGEVHFALPEPGMYWLNLSYPANRQPTAELLRRYSYAATLEVLPQ